MRLLVRKMLDRLEQTWVFLPHDLVQSGGSHPGILHLLEGFACVHSLMLSGVSNDEYPVLWFDLVEESPHLLGAGETRFVEHIKVWSGWCGSGLCLAANQKTLESVRAYSRLPQCPRRFGRWGEAFNRVAAALGSFADGLKRGGLTGSGQSLQSVDAVGRGQYLFDHLALGWIQERSCGSLGGRLLGVHDRRESVLAPHHMGYVCPLLGDGLGGSEASSGVMFLAFRLEEVALASAAVKLRANLSVGSVPHAPAQCVTQDCPLVIDRLALEVPGSCVAHGFLGVVGVFGPVLLVLGALAGVSDYLLRLVAERGGHLFMSCKDLFRGENLLLIASRVCRDLGRRWSVLARLLQMLLYLLRPGTECIKVLLREAFDLRCAALSGLDLVPSVPQLVGEGRLIHGGRKVLGIEVALGLNGAELFAVLGAVRPHGHIEDDGMGVKLRRGVSIHRAGGIMLELRGYEFACGFGLVIASDPRLGVPLQLG